MPLKQDLRWMQRAMDLAEKGRAQVSPNPMVGACLVKNNRLIAEGYHPYFGGPHAEIVALRRAGKAAKGAVLYVTLEPCSTWGKTPPCVDAVIRSGVREVVIGTMDRNPVHKNKSAKMLRKAGIRVRSGILEKELIRQNETFFKYITKRMPYVTLKMAQTLDGKIATAAGESKWITGKAARAYVQRLRLEQDGVMVGKNTLLTDDPSLVPRTREKKIPPEKPWRIVMDPELKSSKHAKVLKGKPLTIFIISEKTYRRSKIKKSEPNRILIPVSGKNGRLNLRELMLRLAGLGVAKLLVEGGGETAWSLLKEGLVDKVVWLVAPKIIGGRSARTSVEGDGVEKLAKAFKINQLNVKRLGEDWIFEGVCR